MSAPQAASQSKSSTKAVSMTNSQIHSETRIADLGKPKSQSMGKCCQSRVPKPLRPPVIPSPPKTPNEQSPCSPCRAPSPANSNARGTRGPNQPRTQAQARQATLHQFQRSRPIRKIDLCQPALKPIRQSSDA